MGDDTAEAHLSSQALQLFMPSLSARYREDAPLAGYSFEDVLAAVGELDARTGDQVFDGARDQYFATSCHCGDACADMHGYSRDIVSDDLALARVEPCAHLDPERQDGALNRTCAANRAGRAVERGEEAIACRVDLPSAEAREFFPYGAVVCFQQVAPPPISH